MTKRKSPVQWDEPPAPRARHDWEAIANDLRSKPMVWGLVFEQCPTSRYLAVFQSHVTAVRRDRGFETMSRNNKKVWGDDGKERRTCDMWMRYNPDLVSELTEVITKRKEK